MSKFFGNFKNYIKNAVIPIFTRIQWLEIPVSTYVRLALTIIVSINTVITMFGLNPIPISESTLYLVISVTLNIVVLIINTFKNNSTSKEALISDKIMRALKAASALDEDATIGKLQDILKELNGKNNTASQQEHTNIEERHDNSIQ